MLAPLTKLTSIKLKLELMEVKQKTFELIKQIVARNILLASRYFVK